MEVRDLVSRIGALLKAGWTEVVVVTDHGWLLVPHGLPKVELKAFLTETRWSRCAALKADAQTDALAFKWHWNPSVMMASPPGAGSFRAAIEYSHGGVSLQEMVTPVLRVKAAQPDGSFGPAAGSQVDRGEMPGGGRWRFCGRSGGCPHQPIRREHVAPGGQASA